MNPLYMISVFRQMVIYIANLIFFIQCFFRVERTVHVLRVMPKICSRTHNIQLQSVSVNTHYQLRLKFPKSSVFVFFRDMEVRSTVEYQLTDNIIHHCMEQGGLEVPCELKKLKKIVSSHKH